MQGSLPFASGCGRQLSGTDAMVIPVLHGLGQRVQGLAEAEHKLGIDRREAAVLQQGFQFVEHGADVGVEGLAAIFEFGSAAAGIVSVVHVAA